MSIDLYTTQDISELEFPGADQEGYDSLKWVMYHDHLVWMEQERDEGYEEGDMEGYERGYEDGVDSVSKLPIQGTLLVGSVQDCKEYFNKMRDRDPYPDELAEWLETDAGDRFWG